MPAPLKRWLPGQAASLQSPFAFFAATPPVDPNYPWSPQPYVLGAACDGNTCWAVTRDQLASFFTAHKERSVIFHDAPASLEVLQRAIGNGLDLYDLVERNRVWDTQLLHRLLVLGEEGHTAKESRETTLEACVKLQLEVNLSLNIRDSGGAMVENAFGKWLGKPYAEIEAIFLRFIRLRAMATFLLHHQLHSRLHRLLARSRTAVGYLGREWLQGQMHRWGPQTHHIQLKGAIVLRTLTANGLHVDLKRVGRLRERLEATKAALLERLKPYGFLPSSSRAKVLQAILERQEREDRTLTLPRTPTGPYATNSEALQEFRARVPFIHLWLQFREVEQLLACFTDKMTHSVLHPRFNPLEVTGRTSSSGEINAQGLPRDDAVRDCFQASPGHLFIDADFQQVELATLAQTAGRWYGQTPKMAVYLNAGKDLHRVVAAKLMKKPADQVTTKERNKAKAINFGKPGGMGTAAIVQVAKTQFGVTLTADEAQLFENVWFNLFPEMPYYLGSPPDAGLALAEFLQLTPAKYHQATGRGIFDRRRANNCEPWLGGMCFKVVSARQPQTSGDSPRFYRDREIAFFWSELRKARDRFPADIQEAIQSRSPSPALRRRLAEFVTSAPVFTITGRVRANAGYCQRLNTPFQGLAADGAKLALWRLWRAGYRMVNFIHDQVLIEVPEHARLGFEQERVKHIMTKAMREVVPEVTVKVTANVMRTWSKASVVGLDDRGRKGAPVNGIGPKPRIQPTAISLR